MTMLKRDPNFQRLKLRGREIFRRVSYWQGPDHLLLVEVRGYTEHYRRFNFRDVQALVARRTSDNVVITVGLLLVAALFGLLAATADDVTSGRVCLVMMLPFVIGVIVNLWLGPTCACDIRTAVQQERLPGLNRLRQFHYLRDTLTPAIQAAQAALPPLGERILAPTPDAAASSAPPPHPRTVSKEGPVRHYHARYHEVSFYLLLVESVVLMIELALESAGNEVVDLVLMAGLIGCLIGAAIKQSRSDVPAILRRLVWISFTYYGIMIAVAIVYGIYLVFAGSMVDSLENLNPWEHPVILVMDFVGIAFGLVVGGVGIQEVRRFRHAWKNIAPPAPPALPVQPPTPPLPPGLPTLDAPPVKNLEPPLPATVPPGTPPNV